MIVVKVGGSLFDHPQLFPGLRRWLADQAVPALLVPGGGGVADCVRAWDRTHDIGEEASHHIALTSLKTSLALFQQCFPSIATITNPNDATSHNLSVLDVAEYASTLDTPKSWYVTTDSYSAYAAGMLQCPLYLLKSVHVPIHLNWVEVAFRGQVDLHFPEVVQKYQLQVESVYFREYLRNLVREVLS